MDRDLERLFSALGSQIRLRMLDLISQHKEMCVCELVDVLRMSQANVSHHLGILRDADLVLDRKVGTWVFYRANPDVLEQSLGGLSRRLHANLAEAANDDPEARVAARCAR